MSIISGLSVAYKAACMQGVHQPGDTYKLALYSENANLNPLVGVYTSSGEVSGQGYSKGGVTLSGMAVEIDGVRAVLGWNKPAIWPNATISARGGLIYNVSKQGAVVGVIDLGGLVTSTNGNFRVELADLFAIA